MDQRIELVIALVKRDIKGGLSLEKLTRSMNLSVSRLHNLFKEQTGMSPAHYVRTLRMGQARELLQTTSLSVKQVMNDVGLRDRSHFDREFKKAYGTTPVQCSRAALCMWVLASQTFVWQKRP